MYSWLFTRQDCLIFDCKWPRDYNEPSSAIVIAPNERVSDQSSDSEVCFELRRLLSARLD